MIGLDLELSWFIMTQAFAGVFLQLTTDHSIMTITSFPTMDDAAYVLDPFYGAELNHWPVSTCATSRFGTLYLISLELFGLLFDLTVQDMIDGVGLGLVAMRHGWNEDFDRAIAVLSNPCQCGCGRDIL